MVLRVLIVSHVDCSIFPNFSRLLEIAVPFHLSFCKFLGWTTEYYKMPQI
jgi:hypothetical protein